MDLLFNTLNHCAKSRKVSHHDNGLSQIFRAAVCPHKTVLLSEERAQN